MSVEFLGGKRSNDYDTSEITIVLGHAALLSANSGDSGRLCASEIGLRADLKTSQGMPSLARKSINSGVAER